MSPVATCWGDHYVLSTMSSPSADDTVLWLKSPFLSGPVLPGAPACVCVLGSGIPPLLPGPTLSRFPLPQPASGALRAGQTSLAHSSPGQFSVHTQHSGVHADGKHSSSFSFSGRIERKIATISLESKSPPKTLENGEFSVHNI